ncbi:class E sortase [Streptomyces sp. NC-S4]
MPVTTPFGPAPALPLLVMRGPGRRSDRSDELRTAGLGPFHFVAARVLSRPGRTSGGRLLMITMRPEEAAHGADAPSGRQHYEPAEWPGAWYTYAPQTHPPIPSPDPWTAHPHPYDWPEHDPSGWSQGWYTQAPQACAPSDQPEAWYTRASQAQTPMPPPSHDWPSPPQEAFTGQFPELKPVFESTAVPRSAGPVPEAPIARAAGARRAAGRGAGSGRRRAPRRPTGARRRRKEAPSAVAAWGAGALLATSGLAMVLFVVHQTWWTNVEARAEADAARSQLEQAWSGGTPESAAQDAAGAGEGFAIIRIPKLGLTSPIAEGTSTERVLDKGLVGHYTGTGLPADPTGNVVLAAHRNTHGEPFREIDRLVPGDRITVETATGSYTYEVAGRIPETSPADVSVVRAIPGGSPFTEPGRYITLTTCTPEFSTRGRLIVFGRLVEERLRGQA